MEILQLRVHNFRQFYGDFTIDFASGDKNITIVAGQNGYGKTGIFRAIYYNLFGLKRLPQDADNTTKDAELHLVNLNKLNENMDEVIKAEVTMTFKHGKYKYVLTRSLDEMKLSDDESIISSEEFVELRMIDENGNTDPKIITDNEKIKQIIFDIIPDSVKNFYFFDGEKIEKLAKTDKYTRNEIKNGITSFLQIDDLDKAISLLQKKEREQNEKIRHKSKETPLEKAYEDRNNLEQKIQFTQNSIEGLEENLEAIKEEIEVINSQLVENVNIQDLMSSLELEKQKKDNLEGDYNSLKQTMSEYIRTYGAFIYMKDSLVETLKILKEYMEKNKDSYGVSKQLIERILTDSKCFCGNEFNNNDDTYNLLLELRNNVGDIETDYKVSELYNEIEEKLRRTEEKMFEIHNLLENVSLKKEAIEECQKEIENLNSKIVNEGINSENYNHKELTERKEKCIRDKEETQAELISLKRRKEEQEDELKGIESRIEELIKANKALDIEREKLEILVKLKTHFLNTKDQYMDLTKKELSIRTTENYKKLISSSSQNTIKEIHINDKYEIDTIGWSKDLILQDLSAGQRQFVALSFVTALASMASNSDIGDIDMPLFMDTPFARIDRENRFTLIKRIPLLTSQWILLVTDSEVTKDEFTVLSETEKLGKYYFLEKIDEGKTLIKENTEINTYIQREYKGL